MTQEEKAKAYDEAIERAKVFKEHLLEINEKDYADEMNYIFPALKESKDERIRKALICHYQGDGCICTNEYRIDYKDILAWLEKQGECNISHDDEIMIKQLEEYFSTGKGLQNTKETIVEWLKDVRKKLEKQGEQKSDNWFQELEDKLANATPQQLAEWKEKYFKEEPTEWSEEDKEKINEIIDYLDYEGHKTDVEFLKSLRPQPTWKPTDKQLKALELAVDRIYKQFGCSSDLLSLVEELKKL